MSSVEHVHISAGLWSMEIRALNAQAPQIDGFAFVASVAATECMQECLCSALQKHDFKQLQL